MTRPARATELAALAGWEAGADTARWLGETGLSWHRRVLADPDAAHLVLDRDGRAAGFAVLCGLLREDRVIELRRMVVAPELRGHGVGRELLNSALHAAYHEHRASSVWLDVRPDNDRARALYESADFRLEGSSADDDLLILRHTRVAASE